MQRGKYVIISGGEGSGKSTLVNALKSHYPDLVITREPGGSDFWRPVRAMLASGEYELSPWSEFYLFMADRAEHFANLIIPSIDRGLNVLSDRGFPETFAYQLFAKMGQSDTRTYLQEIKSRNWPYPDLWIFLDLDPVEGLRRRGLSGTMDAFDRRSLDFHQKVREGFLLLAKQAPFPVEVVPADQSPSEVLTEVQRHLSTLF